MQLHVSDHPNAAHLYDAPDPADLEELDRTVIEAMRKSGGDPRRTTDFVIGWAESDGDIANCLGRIVMHEIREQVEAAIARVTAPDVPTHGQRDPE